jgi:hypothetical protein
MNRDVVSKCSRLLVLVAIVGCGQSTPTASNIETAGEKPKASASKTAGKDKPVAEESTKRKFKPVEIGATSGESNKSADSGERVESARVALKPLQILIGSWNGTSRNAAIDQPSWAWDLKTDPKQPALRVKSEKGQYVRDGRLTFVPASQEFIFTATGADGKKREFHGNFSQDVQDVPGDVRTSWN